MEIFTGNKNKEEAKVEQKKELTREELLNILNQISEQDRKLVEENKKLRRMLEEIGNANFFKRLDYLFKVIKEESPYFTEEFKHSCSKEIQESLFPVEEPEE